MSNVKPEHVDAASSWITRDCPTPIEWQTSRHYMVQRIAQLYADLDTARADARVLAEECAEWRDAAGIKCLGGWNMTYQNEYGTECYQCIVKADTTDASGALERNRSQP